MGLSSSTLSTGEDEVYFVGAQNTFFRVRLIHSGPKCSSLTWNSMLPYYVDSCLREAFPCSFLLTLEFPIFGANYFPALVLSEFRALFLAPSAL